MNRLGKSLITDSELLSLDRIVAEIDAVEAASVSELAAALLASERLSAACIGPSEERFLEALERITPEPRPRGVKVLLNGRARQGRLGARARRSRQPGHTLVDSLADAEAMVDFTRPDAALANVRAAVDAGVAVRRRHDGLGHRRSRATRRCRSSTRRTSRSARC